MYAKAALSAWSPASALASASSNRRSASAGLPAARSAAALAISANERPQLSPLSVIAWTARSASCCADWTSPSSAAASASMVRHMATPQFSASDSASGISARAVARPSASRPCRTRIERFGAGAPGQAAGVVLLAEQLDGSRRAPRRRRRNPRGWSLTRPDAPAPRRRPGRRPPARASSSAWLKRSSARRSRPA